MSAERLQKVLASAGIASRRDCEELISTGRVAVNGKVARVLGARVDPEHDEITVDGQPIGRLHPRTYVMLHKPAGVVSTAEDPQGRPTVVDLVDLPVRLFPVGRLDYDSEGLLLLTDDGELTQRLTHPSYEVEKEYRALLNQAPTSDAIREWRASVPLDGVPTAPAWVELLENTEAGAWVRVVLHEGRKRQIREVAQLLGYNVLRLIRVREGPLSLGDLPAGAWRQLTSAEVEALWEHVGGRAEAQPGDDERNLGEHSVGGSAQPRRRPWQDHVPARRDTTRETRARTSRAPEDRTDQEAAPAGPRDVRRQPIDRPSSRDDEGDAAGQPREPRAPRGPRYEDNPRRDERPYEGRGGYGGPRRDDRPYEPRGPRRDEPRERGGGYGGPRRDDRPYEPRGPRRDEPRERGGYGGPRRDDRPYESRGPRRESRGGGYGGPRRDDRPYEPRGPRRDEQPYEPRAPRRDEDRGASDDQRRERPRDERREGNFDERHGDWPERGNERPPQREQEQERRGPSREWHERRGQEQRGRSQRPVSRDKHQGRAGERGRPPKRPGMSFRPKPSKDDQDER